jgi:hypothetical protein
MLQTHNLEKCAEVTLQTAEQGRSGLRQGLLGGVKGTLMRTAEPKAGPR